MHTHEALKLGWLWYIYMYSFEAETFFESGISPNKMAQ